VSSMSAPNSRTSSSTACCPQSKSVAANSSRGRYLGTRDDGGNRVSFLSRYGRSEAALGNRNARLGLITIESSRRMIGAMPPLTRPPSSIAFTTMTSIWAWALGREPALIAHAAGPRERHSSFCWLANASTPWTEFLGRRDHAPQALAGSVCTGVTQCARMSP